MKKLHGALILILPTFATQQIVNGFFHSTICGVFYQMMEDACNDMISFESYLSLEQNSWNFHDEEQKKKFKYMFENDDNGTYLIISVKKHI